MSRSMKELQELQALPLKYKVMITEQRIKDWIENFGEDGVYISFSGGKDSTVLLHIVRSLYPNIPAVFVDTGLEYPEIREFIKTFDNVVWLKPKKNFRKVINDYGYPFISKDIANKVYGARRYVKGLTSIEPLRYKRLMGTATQPDGTKSKFNCVKYKFMLEAPFEISDYCCNAMKKQPCQRFEKETGRKPILAQMACESHKRTMGWLKTGCNGFDSNHPQSNPISFWTEQDVLLYIRENNIPICPVYGDIIQSGEAFITTGCNRTGCVFCGFGCHMEKKGEGRFLRLKETHPKLYDYIMRAKDEGGLGYKEVIDWLNKYGDLHIEY